MTTPTPRWTAETADLLVPILAQHEDLVEIGAFRCACGERFPGASAGATAAAMAFLRHKAEAVHTALADAGVLILVGGETRQEWGVADVPDHPAEVWAVESETRARLKAASSASVDGKVYCRTITTHFGPWREVTDDPA